MQSPRRKHRKTFNTPGHAHFLTFSCQHRLPLLNSDRTCQWFVDAVDRARTSHDMAIWAYVIMPEHAHMLVWPRREQYRMGRWLADCKKPVSDRAKSWLVDQGETAWFERLTVKHGGRQVFRFWLPGGGHDHNLMKEKTVRAVIDYIHGNPVRRGLVEDPRDWRWSSAAFWDGQTDVPLRMDPIDL